MPSAVIVAACHSKACAPPPIGKGGSMPRGGGGDRAWITDAEWLDPEEIYTGERGTYAQIITPYRAENAEREFGEYVESDITGRHPSLVTPDEVAADIHGKVQDAVVERGVVVNVPDEVVGRLIEEGRLKSQHETGTSQGYLGGARLEWDKNAFGMSDADVADGKAPIYGTIPLDNAPVGVRNYGGIGIVLDGSAVGPRTTYSLGDSLQNAAPISVGGIDPSGGQMARATSWYNVAGDVVNGKRVRSYVEAQVHGGVDVNSGTVREVLVYTQSRNPRKADGSKDYQTQERFIPQDRMMRAEALAEATGSRVRVVPPGAGGKDIPTWSEFETKAQPRRELRDGDWVLVSSAAVIVAACRSKACAPPPVGKGGSLPEGGGDLRYGQGQGELFDERVGKGVVEGAGSERDGMILGVDEHIHGEHIMNRIRDYEHLDDEQIADLRENDPDEFNELVLQHYKSAIEAGEIDGGDAPREAKEAHAKEVMRHLGTDDPVEAAEMLIDRVNDLGRDAVVIRVNEDAFTEIAMDGTVRNQFEVGLSNGAYNPALRAEHESKLYGISHGGIASFEAYVDGSHVNYSAEGRPLYGYMQGSTLADEVRHYGQIALVIPPGSGMSVGVTFGDSLGNAMGSPLEGLMLESNHRIKSAHYLDVLAAASPTHDVKGYVEAQVFGDLASSKISEIRIESSGGVDDYILLDSVKDYGGGQAKLMFRNRGAADAFTSTAVDYWDEISTTDEAWSHFNVGLMESRFIASIVAPARTRVGGAEFHASHDQKKHGRRARGAGGSDARKLSEEEALEKGEIQTSVDNVASKDNTSIFPKVEAEHTSRTDTKAPGADDRSAVRAFEPMRVKRGSDGKPITDDKDKPIYELKPGASARRIPHAGETVDVYRNLGRGNVAKGGFEDGTAQSVMSVGAKGGGQQNVASSTSMLIDNPRPGWDNSNKRAAERDGKRGVHAFVRGEVAEYPAHGSIDTSSGGWQKVTYYPESQDFFRPDTRQRWGGSEQVYLVNGEMFVRGASTWGPKSNPAPVGRIEKKARGLAASATRSWWVEIGDLFEVPLGHGPGQEEALIAAGQPRRHTRELGLDQEGRRAAQEGFGEEEEGGLTQADKDNAYGSYGVHHTSLGRWSKPDAVGDLACKAKACAPPPVGKGGSLPSGGGGGNGPALEETQVKPFAGAVKAKESYEFTNEDEVGKDYSTMMADPDRGRAMAKAYQELPDYDPDAEEAYRHLRSEVKQQYDHMIASGVSVEVTSEDPYANIGEMMADLEQNGRLKVMATASTGSHDFFTDEENDMFRAVHDFYGHAATGRDFSRHGEEAAFASHVSMFDSPLAERALVTETRGQNSMLNYGPEPGVFAEQKIALMPERFVREGLSASAAEFHASHDQKAHGRRKGAAAKYPSASDAFIGIYSESAKGHAKTFKQGDWDFRDREAAALSESDEFKQALNDFDSGDMHPKLGKDIADAAHGRGLFEIIHPERELTPSEKLAVVGMQHIGVDAWADVAKIARERSPKTATFDELISAGGRSKELLAAYGMNKLAEMSWNRTFGGDGGYMQTRLQAAVARTVGGRVPPTGWLKDSAKRYPANGDSFQPLMDSWAKAHYSETQSLLKKAGVSELAVRRGTTRAVTADANGQMVASMNPLSAWTTSPTVSNKFMKMASGDTPSELAMTVKSSNVFSALGFGSEAWEHEIKVVTPDLGQRTVDVLRIGKQKIEGSPLVAERYRTASAAVIEFHAPGKHDQKTHGRRKNAAAKLTAEDRSAVDEFGLDLQAQTPQELKAGVAADVASVLTEEDALELIWMADEKVLNNNTLAPAMVRSRGNSPEAQAMVKEAGEVHSLTGEELVKLARGEKEVWPKNSSGSVNPDDYDIWITPNADGGFKTMSAYAMLKGPREYKGRTRDPVTGDPIQSYKLGTPEAAAAMRNVAASAIIGGWQHSSTGPVSVELQASVARRWGLDRSPFMRHRNGQDRFGNPEKTNHIFDKVRDQIYASTQADLKARFPSGRIPVHRGIKMDRAFKRPEGEVTFEHNPISSWSTSPGMAATFAGSSGTVFSGMAPIERVFSTPFTGPGSARETEVVVIGSASGSRGFATPSDKVPSNIYEFRPDFYAFGAVSIAAACTSDVELHASHNQKTHGRRKGAGGIAAVRDEYLAALDKGGYRGDAEAIVNRVAKERGMDPYDVRFIFEKSQDVVRKGYQSRAAALSGGGSAAVGKRGEEMKAALAMMEEILPERAGFIRASSPEGKAAIAELQKLLPNADVTFFGEASASSLKGTKAGVERFDESVRGSLKGLTIGKDLKTREGGRADVEPYAQITTYGHIEIGTKVTHGTIALSGVGDDYKGSAFRGARNEAGAAEAIAVHEMMHLADYQKYLAPNKVDTPRAFANWGGQPTPDIETTSYGSQNYVETVAESAALINVGKGKPEHFDLVRSRGVDPDRLKP